MLIKLDKKQQNLLFVLTFVTLGLAVLFLRSYLLLIVFSAIMAVLFSPINARFIRKGKSKGKASFYTFMVSMFVVIVPLILVILITGWQIKSLVDTVNSQNYSTDFNSLLNDLVSFLNSTFASLGVDKVITVQSITDSVSSALSSISSNLVDNVVSAFSGFFSLITASIIYIYVFMSMLKNNDKIQELIKKLNPLGDDVANLYIDRSSAMTKATVRGQFIIAFMQGLESSVVLALVGMEQLFFFFLLLLTVMSIIPLGAGIITIPIGIVMILTGNVWQGTVVILNHLLIVTNIDNVMRPILVPKSARLDPALMILAVFSGMAIFGFLGVVIGPVIMIMIVTTIQIYLEVFHQEESIDRSKTPKNKSAYIKIKNKLHISK